MIVVHWLELKPEQGGVLSTGAQALELPDGSSVVQGLLAIGLTENRIATLLNERAVAIFGLYATENTVLYAGDRIEILDSLNFDPMESRRRRAQHKVITKRQKELARYERRSRRQAKTQP